MKRLKAGLICGTLSVILAAGALVVSKIPFDFSKKGSVQSTELSEIQRNAISMLNYISVLTQEINASKNSRLFMEKAYSELINNIYPNAVDSSTLSQLTGLLDMMEGYRMISEKRDRLQYIYEQNQARTIRAAIPDPQGLIRADQSFRLTKMVPSLVYMAVDSYTSYTSYTEELNSQYLKDGWELDDEESKALHESRKGVFSYMVGMVSDYGLPGDYTLTESLVEEFVKWKNNENTIGRIQFLESNKSSYQEYGGYWLTLAMSYYENGDYGKCLECITSYEELHSRIFRKDYEYAKVLSLGIAAADEVLEGEERERVINDYAKKILDNSDHADWTLRYFAAQTYLRLMRITENDKYLRMAYSVALDNVNYLVGKQVSMNEEYLSDVHLLTAAKEASKEEKNQVKAYNEMITAKRKTELPPVYEPLRLNCDLLFALAGRLNISADEKKKIDGILHHGNRLFLCGPLDDMYWFEKPENIITQELECSFLGDEITLPAEYVTDGAQIDVSVKSKDSDTTILIADWKVSKVERK